MNRKQKLKFKANVSLEEEIPIGLPQGTPLSVILFILYINDIVNVSLHTLIALFADDTVVIVKSKNVDEVIELMNHDLKLIYE